MIVLLYFVMSEAKKVYGASFAETLKVLRTNEIRGF